MASREAWRCQPGKLQCPLELSSQASIFLHSNDPVYEVDTTALVIYVDTSSGVPHADLGCGKRMLSNYISKGAQTRLVS